MAEHGLKCILEPKFVSISCAENYLAGLGYMLVDTWHIPTIK